MGDNKGVNAIRPGFFPTKWNLENLSMKIEKSNFGHTLMKRFEAQTN